MSITSVTFEMKMEGGHSALVENPHDEVVRMLRNVADALDFDRLEVVGGMLRDTNGNACGAWHFSTEETE